MAIYKGIRSRKILVNHNFASTDSVYQTVNLGDYLVDKGRFALSVYADDADGTGQIDVTYETSVDGVHFATPVSLISNVVKVVESRAVFYPYGPANVETDFFKYIKFTFTEDGTGVLDDVSATLIIQ